MEVDIRFSGAARTVILRISGRMTGADLHAALLSMLEDPKWDPNSGVLLDGRGLSEAVVTLHDAEEITLLTEMFRERIGPGRFAVLVGREIDELLAELLIAAVKAPVGRTFSIFARLEDACAWLRINPAVVEAPTLSSSD
jgi:hypothetical protein